MTSRISITIGICVLMIGKFSNCFSTTLPANPDTAIYFIKYPDILTTRDSADFIRLILPKDITNKNGLYPFLEYNKKGKLIMRGLTHSQYYRFILEGPVISYSDSGKRKSLKNYINGYLNGDAYTYYPNGAVYSVERYKGFVPGALDYGKKIECHDTTGKIIAENGKGHWIKYLDDDLKTVYEEGEIQNGLETGVWTVYSGEKKQEITFKDGVVTKHAEVNTNDKIYEKVDSQPFFRGDDLGMFNWFLSVNVRYPAEDREKDTQGKTFIKFVIEKDGGLTNFEVVKSPSKTMAAEVLRVMNLSPQWTPATVNGVAVRSYFTIPVNFTISNAN